MANNKTLLKAIERKDYQLRKQSKKLANSRSKVDRDKARDEIQRLQSLKLDMQNQIKLNTVMGDVQRTKEIERAERVHASIKDDERCCEVGVECPW